MVSAQSSAGAATAARSSTGTVRNDGAVEPTTAETRYEAIQRRQEGPSILSPAREAEVTGFACLGGSLSPGVGGGVDIYLNDDGQVSVTGRVIIGPNVGFGASTGFEYGTITEGISVDTCAEGGSPLLARGCGSVGPDGASGSVAGVAAASTSAGITFRGPAPDELAPAPFPFEGGEPDLQTSSSPRTA